ncbi:FHA domain-containing protein [bacterium]|nr:FHA domain-containing protein [bacterium]
MATLLAIRGPITGARITLNDDSTRIGRTTSSDIAIPDAVVSRTHAIIRRQGHAWMLEDCDSQAGTLLNGTRLKGMAALSPNDEIRIGHSIFLFDSEFDLQNADFTDNSVYISSSQDETMVIEPVATLESGPRPDQDAPARQGLELLTELGELFDSSRVAFGDALKATVGRMGRLMQADVSLLMMYDFGAKRLRASVALASGDVLADQAVLRKVYTERKAILLSDKPEPGLHPAMKGPKPPKVRSVVSAPLVVDDSCLGLIYFERQELDAYTLKDLRLVQSLAKLLAVFVEARQKAEAATLKTNFQKSDSQLIGGSPRFRKALDMVRRVAEVPSSVLLVGETGTGKEMIAAEIHRLSEAGRHGRPYVAINCAAIPESLFEAELFGHEKGSFTGAHRMRQGYVEQAHGGTLFLDEIGELSLHLQPKLLRFLQERTFMRVGGTRVLRADVRVIAATNRDLGALVSEGRFREDLYHRLAVLPVEIPPLRERREDIRMLAEHFAQHYARSLSRSIVGISDEATIMLEKHEWPGNVRELANTMERAVLLCDGKVILPRHLLLPRVVHAGGSAPAATPEVLIDATKAFHPRNEPTQYLPLDEIEKAHVYRVLDAMNGNQVKAADVLGIHRNTLRKKLHDWGEVDTERPSE